MTASLTTLTRTATQTSILASARFLRLDHDLIAAATPTALLIDPFARPGAPADDPGIATVNTVGASLNIVYNVDPQRRTVYLAIDRDNAPLTGNYVVQIDSETALTYNATSEAPADVDALIAGIVDMINGDTGATADIVVADAYSMAGDSTNDAIRLRGVVTRPDTTRATYIVTSSTAFPGGAALTLVREIDSASVRIWGRPSITVPSSRVLGGPGADMLNAWRPIVDLGEVALGRTEQLNVATLDAIWVELYGVATAADTYATTVDWVAVYVALALEEAP
jgi:hypothetical protein